MPVPLWNGDENCADQERFTEKCRDGGCRDASVLKVRCGNGPISPFVSLATSAQRANLQARMRKTAPTKNARPKGKST